MTQRITQLFKDQARLGKVISVFFFAGIVVSAFVLFMLPHNLVYKGQVASVDGAWPVFIQLFAVIFITFLIGLGAVLFALLTKKETIVYLEKRKTENATTEGTSGGQAEDSDLVKAFRAAIDQVKGEKETLQSGLNSISKQLDAGQGAIYVAAQKDDKRVLELRSGYALNMAESNKVQFEFGEGLVGQAALSGKSLYIDDIPEGYITVLSGLGSASPRFLLLSVIRKGNEIKGVMELATFSPLKENIRKQIDEMATLLADKIG
ncbi:MAG: hypothetical protein DI538_09260 [Azospira oryzae]|jgi:hypothetical protein|nr:hypothetical protein [Cytophaga sp.]PZR38571.1 MAG: hypothetical protein DI538_09260 [Azospira oryzae]